MEQSCDYLIPFHSLEQRERVLNVVALHNSEHAHTSEYVRYALEDPFEQLSVGAPLGPAAAVCFKPGKMYASPNEGPALKSAILVRQSGDRAATATYLRWYLMRMLPDVYVAGVHAVDCYACSDAMRKRLAWNTQEPIPKKRIGLKKAGAAPDGARVAPCPRPAKWTTRFCVPNPTYAALLNGLTPDERKRVVQEQKSVPPYITAYSTKTDGFVVGDRHFKDQQSAESHVWATGCL